MTEKQDWEAGRNLAAQLIEEAATVGYGAQIRARWRTADGTYLAQNNFAKKYLQRLIDEPQLLEGFAAVISSFTHETEQGEMTGGGPDHGQASFEEWTRLGRI